MPRALIDLPVKTWEGRFLRIEAEKLLRAAGILPVRDRALLES